MLDIFNDWNFKGSLSAGVVDQRIDNTENVEEIESYTKPLLNYFTLIRFANKRMWLWSCAN